MQNRIVPVAALAAACLLSLACQPGDAGPQGEAASPAGEGEIAARVEGVEITTAELDDWIKEDLFRARAGNAAKLYELRASALARLLDERTLAVLAKQRGVSPDDLIAAEVEAMGPVDEAEAREFYDANRANLGQVAFEDVQGQILDFLAARRETDAVRRLREGAAVEVLLEAPRFDVAAVGPSKGPENARVTIVEFSDFQCPFCKRVNPTIDAILKRYPEDVRIVYRNFPLRSHSRARPAAEAALCAQDQGKFWAYHDKLFDNSRKLSDEDLTGYAEELGLDTASFEKCYAEGRFSEQVAQDASAGAKAGVSGTPAFFVNGVMLSGAKPAEEFFEVIDAELARLKEGA